jgi:putative cardiolipin synthase
MEFLAAGNDLHWTTDVRVISDPPDKVSGARRENWLMTQLLPLIEGCRKSLEIVSPYFIPGRTGTSVLAGHVNRGVRVGC